MTDESAADRLARDPRPKGQAIPRGPTVGDPDDPRAETKARERRTATALPGTEAQGSVHPKQME